MAKRAMDPQMSSGGRSGGCVQRATGRVGASDGAITPRLLDLEAATYLSVSPWTIRDLEAKGVLPRVRVPLPDGGELRKLRFDRADLDRLIEEGRSRIKECTLPRVELSCSRLRAPGRGQLSR
jgi:excisionase family DNA binding protein